jgi:TonB family protein
MNRIALSVFATVIVPVTLVAQTTRKIKDKETDEVFVVLKSDESTKHGEYKKFSYHKNLLVQGYYRLGNRDSVWECFDAEGKLTLKYDFGKNELLSFSPNDQLKGKKYKVLSEASGTDTTLSRPPIFLGGDELILDELAKSIRYPSPAIENGTSGKVYVLFKVDRSGKASNYHVDAPLGFGLDDEAIRVLKLLPDNWLPGMVGQRPVDVEVSLPIMFRLE